MKKALLRGLRNGLALLATGAIAYYQNDPRYLLIAPAVNALCKFLRDKYGIKYLPL